MSVITTYLRRYKLSWT